MDKHVFAGAESAGFEALLESAPDGIVLVDDTGRIALVNRRAEDLFRRSRDELLGREVEILVPERFHPVHVAHRQGYVADPRTREMGLGLDLYGQRGDGTEFPVEISLSPMNADGRTYVVTVVRDVTDRRTAEMRFEALLEAAPDAIVLAEADGRIAMANRRTTELFGWSVEELVGMGVEQLVPPRFRGSHVQHRAGYVADPRTRRMGAELELYGLRKDGTEFPVEISLSPLSSGGETLTVTIVRDFSERRAIEVERLELARAQAARAGAEAAAARLRLIDEVAEEALLHSSLEELLPAVLERVVEGLAGEAGVILLGSDGAYFVHAAVGLEGAVDKATPIPHGQGIAGRIAAERHWLTFDDVSIAKSPALRKSGIQSLVGAPLMLAGETIGVIQVGSRRADDFGEDDGQLLQLLAARVALAIEHARLYDATQSAQARLTEIVSDLDAIVWESADPARARLTFISVRAEELLGYPVERWLEEESFWASILHDEDRDLTLLFFGESGRAAGRHEHEYRVVAADGREIRVRDVVRVGHSEAGEVTQRGMLIDVSERRELETRLLQAQKMDAVGQLAGGIAHDFNNLLTVISGYGARLERRATDDQTRFELGELSRAAARAGELTGQLLTFSRQGAQRRELVDVNALAGTIETMLQRLIGEDIALTLSLASDADRVEADPGQLEQVLVNLVVNARDAMAGGGEIRIETRAVSLDASEAAVWQLQPGRHVVLAVSDTGEGMPPHVRERIFEPFFTTKPPGKGTGLGLATVYGIVEQARGRIRVESQPGKGTEFAIALPSAAPAEVDSSPDTSRGTILLVEDEPALRLLARSILSEEGYRVLEAEDGEAALRLAERHPGRIDLVLTDVIMPRVSGPELVEALRGIRPEAQALYMSGYTDSKLVYSGIPQTEIALVRKPFAPDDLLARVEQALTPTR